jgi:hypothetical protein
MFIEVVKNAGCIRYFLYLEITASRFNYAISRCGILIELLGWAARARYQLAPAVRTLTM